MGTFLRPFHKSFSELENGVEMIANGQNAFMCKAILLCGTFDLPARSMFCNGTQYNGKYSC